MKRILMTLTIVAGLGFGASAQFQSNTYNDGFFSTTAPSGQFRDGSANGNVATPILPDFGIYDTQPAPVGGGLLLLAGMGLAYGLRKSKKQ